MADGYPRNDPSAGLAQAAAMSKAQQFEDEKRRIIQSCFSKTEQDGSLLESYITHCRVIEDASSPSEPPSVNSDPNNKKQRVILVAVRKSGRVRMHKARENPNGSFSIGKTWNLDDLQQIMNYPAPHEKGFTVTIVKPYYWQANSTKEKDFFISSMLKIFKKYTGGKIPELVGFDNKELDALIGPGGAQLLAKQRQDEEPKRSRTPSNAPGSNSTSASSSQGLPVPRNLSATQSMDSLKKSPGRNTPPRPQDGYPPPPGPIPPGAMRSPKSNDMLSNRRTPPGGNTPNEPRPPPIPSGTSRGPSGSMGPPSSSSLQAGRQSDSSSRSSQPRQRSGSRPPTQEEERSLRRAPSKEGFRTPSVNSQRSREIRDQNPMPTRSNDLLNTSSNTLPPLADRPPLPKKKSNKDVAAQFKMAANAYSAGGAMTAPKSRPKTPTTPTTPTSMSRSGSRSTQEQVPPMPPSTGFPGDRGREEEVNGNGSGYGRRPSHDEGRRSRSQIRSSKDTPPQLPPPMPREPPPRSEARRPPRESNDLVSPSIALPKPMPKPPREIDEHPQRPLKPLEPLATDIANSLPPPSISQPTTAVDETFDIPLSAIRTASPDQGGLNPPEEPSARSRSRSPARGRRRRSTKVSVLEGFDKSSLSVDIEELLEEFKWDGRGGKIDALEADVKKELAQVESSNIIVDTNGDERIGELSTLLDKAIKECEEMDGLLTLYAVELTSLNDDIAHIENQSQGLQVQTANEKTLQKELQSLLTTISISPQQMDVLKQGSLETLQGLDAIEQTLVLLYRAMKTIDPKGQEAPTYSGRRGSFSDEGVGNMRALQERKDEYQNNASAFISRVRHFMSIKFQTAAMELGKASRNAGSGPRPKLVGHESAYNNFYNYSGLIAFIRDVDSEEYIELQKLYERPTKGLFQEEFRDHISAWKRLSKKPTQEDMDLVFTVPEKETENVAVNAARKLTVKKSLARIRPGGDSVNNKEKNVSGGLSAHESFTSALAEMYNLVFREQNFISELFHLSSKFTSDFFECVSNSSPQFRRLGDLGGLRPADSNKAKSTVIFDCMNEIFSFLIQELQGFVEWCTVSDPVQGVGIMCAMEQRLAKLEGTDQEFLIKTLQKLHDRLAGLFSKFLDQQVQGIEETKVKIKKRKGVIGFMKVFPVFSAKIEEQLPPEGLSGEEELDIRDMVNEGYEKLNKAMFESLQAIAKESPTVASQSVDPEDKEQLNYHIMMIENMHHYLEEVETRQNSVLERFKKRADDEYKEHLGLYLSAVIRRPIGKLLDFIENVEALQRISDSTDISSRSSHSKHVFKKVLANHDGKEIKKGIEALKKRVDKHFGDGDDQVLAQRLVDRILERLQDEYVQTHKRIQMLLLTVYKDQGLEMEFMVQDVTTAFRK